eukprot:g16398.t1
MSKDLAGAGLCGWAQSSIDGSILNDASFPPEEKFLKLFGMKLDWRDYPIVRVAKIEPTMPDGSGPSRAAKNNVAVGDMLLMAGTLQERITLVPSYPGSEPNDALIQKIQRKFARKDNPVAAFAFLPKKHESCYVQLEVKELELGMVVQNGKIASVSPGGVADGFGLKPEDRIVVAHDALREKDPSEIDKRVAPSGLRPLHILVRREKPFSDETRKKAVDVRRDLLPAWQAALKLGGAAPAAGTSAAPSVKASAPAAPGAAPAGPPPMPKTEAPFCAQILGTSKDLVGAGLVGWAQSSIDDKILNDASLQPAEKVAQLFGMRLDWSTYPIVRVSEVLPKLPDGSGPSRAAKNNVLVGDMLIAVGTLQERVTLVPTWLGSSPSDAIAQKVQRKFARKDNPVAAFAFLRAKKAKQYVQLWCPAGDALSQLAVGLGDGGALTDVGKWGGSVGLAAGDKIAVVHDFLVSAKTDTGDVKSKLSALAKTGAHVLFRREAEFPDTVHAKAANVKRAVPAGWKGKDGVPA